MLRLIRRSALWLGHYSNHLNFGLVALCTAIVFAGLLGAPIAVLVPLPLLPVCGVSVVTGAICKLYHGEKVCVRCSSESDLTRPGRAKRHARKFWTYHALKRLNFLGVLALMALCLAAFAGMTFATSLLPEPLDVVVLMLSILACSYWVPASFVYHGRLQAWCPECGFLAQSDAAPEA